MQVDPSGEIRGRRPAHATIVAYLALFVALGGSATALKGKNTVFSKDIKNGQVKTQDLAKGAVNRSKIAKRAVNGRRLALRSVSTSHMIPASITSSLLAADAVTSEKILDLSVGRNDLAKDSVGAAKIAKAAVTSAKLKGGAVTDGKIKDGAVVTDKIAAAAVTGPKLAPGSIPVGKLSKTVVTAEDPIAVGLGGPALSFVDVAHVAAGGSDAVVLTIGGLVTVLGNCAGGASAGLRNDTEVAQRVFLDTGAGETAYGGAVPPGGAAIAPPDPGAGGRHFTFFSYEPQSGRSTHIEVFASHDAVEGCDFHAWAIAR